MRTGRYKVYIFDTETQEEFLAGSFSNMPVLYPGVMVKQPLKGIPFLSINEISELTGLTKTAIRSAIRQGYLKATQPGGIRSVRSRLDWVNTWMTENTYPYNGKKKSSRSARGYGGDQEGGPGNIRSDPFRTGRKVGRDSPGTAQDSARKPVSRPPVKISDKPETKTKLKNEE
jgi:excisionase family DNA binding protein